MRKLGLTILMICFAVAVNAQLTVTTGVLTPTQYVQNVLVGGGVIISNVTFTGDPNQIGEFNAAGTMPYLGLNNGVIMATGDVALAATPNTLGSGGASLGGGNMGAGDADLDILEGTGVGTNDIAILEFDFIPTGDSVKFDFVFGSEEYPEFVNSINDVFGFFLSGPGIAGPYSNGAINIALIPGTTQAVSINNVNPGLNAAFYVDNHTSPGVQSVEYDGYTTVLTAIGEVQCGALHHIKIAIADASDTGWDSGVFLQAGSFTSNTVVLNSNVDVGGNDSILYEGCGSALLDFVRSDTSDTSVYNYTIVGAAGATDFTISADSVVFLPGQDTVTLSFEAIQDGLVEPLETVTIQLIQTICSVVDTQKVTFYISDFPIPIVTTHDTLIACGSNDSVPIWIDVIGPQYVVSWNTTPAQTTDTIWVTPSTTQEYIVTVSDTCGVYTVIDTAEVVVEAPAPISLATHDTLIACGSNDSVPVWVEVIGPPYTVSWNTTPVQTTDTIWVTPSVTQEYIVTVSDICGVFTEIDTAVVVVVSPTPIILTMSLDSTKYCIQDSIEIYVESSGGGGGFIYSWNPVGLADTNFFVNPIITTTYIVEVTDICGTIEKDSVTIAVPNFVPLTASIINIDDTVCSGELVILSGGVAGGVDSYFSWDNGLGNNSPVNVNPVSTTTYILTGQDSCGAIASDTVTITIVPNNFDLHLPPLLTLDCIDETVLLDPNITGGNGTETYLWRTAETTPTIIVAPTSTTTYKVTVTTADGCSSSSDSTKVILPIFLPVVLEVNLDLSINCPGDPVVLIGTVYEGSGKPLTINWSDGANTFTGNNIIVNPLITTTYIAWVNDTCAQDFGAIDSLTVTVPIYTPLVFDSFSQDTLMCLGSQANLGGSVSGGEGNYFYSWGNGSTSDSIIVTPTFSRGYSLIVSDGCGVQIDTSVYVTVSAPTADFNFEYQTATEVQFYDLSYSNIAAYSWTFDNGASIVENPLHNFNYDGAHDVWLLVVDINNCRDSILKTVKPPLLVYAPNSFSPNGDGLNDEFKFKGVGIKSFNLLIYNRWGELMFETDNINNGWNGTLKGKEIPVGVYVYKVRAESYEGIEFEEANKLQLIK
jgi:gliding motility-associated-like protein